MLPEGNTAYPVGTGGFQDLTGGVSMPTNFFGQAGWWTVPTSWACRTNPDGTIQVSPNADFSKPVYAVKINQVGEMCFFDMMRNLRSGNLRPYGC